MTSQEAEPLAARVRALLERLQETSGPLDDAVIAEVASVLEDAASEARQLEARERIYRRTIRRQNQDFERKVLEMSVLRQIGDLIAGCLKLDDLLDRVLSVLVREFRVENSSVMLLDEETGALRIEAGRGASDRKGRSRPGSPILNLGEGIAGWVAASREPLIVNDVSRDVRFQLAGDGNKARGALVCVPLIAEERVLGVLNLSSADVGYFDSLHIHILRIVASQIAGALVGQGLFRELQRLSGRLEEEVAQRTAELRARTADLRRKNDQVTELYFSLERAQRELEQQNRRLVEALTFNDNIVETVNVGISVVSHEGKVMTWNRAMESLTGGALTKERALGNWLDDLPADERERFTLGTPLLGALQSGRSATLHNHVVDLPDGGRRHLNIHHIPVSIANDGSAHVITVMEDVTDNVDLHEQKVRSERLAAITETMVSVNHEVNNPLAVILGYAQMLLQKHESCAHDGAPVGEWVEQAFRDLGRIEAEAMRIREITTKLSSLVEPVVTPYPAGEGVRMVDVNRSR